uniref:(northern house mosquito) hypothetical protein n=1 Tax=Culex pipiens TaxID=7175 RepID=A0A8D8CXJ3_CULPI
MPPKRLPKAKEEPLVQKARYAAKQLNEQELTHELSEVLAADAASSLGRQRSRIDQDERSRSFTPSPERTPPLTVKRRRIHSPSRSRSISPLSSRSPTPSVCSQSPPPVTPRSPAIPVAQDEETLPLLPVTSRAWRYERRLSSVLERELTTGVDHSGDKSRKHSQRTHDKQARKRTDQSSSGQINKRDTKRVLYSEAPNPKSSDQRGPRLQAEHPSKRADQEASKKVNQDDPPAQHEQSRKRSNSASGRINRAENTHVRTGQGNKDHPDHKRAQPAKSHKRSQDEHTRKRFDQSASGRVRKSVQNPKPSAHTAEQDPKRSNQETSSQAIDRSVERRQLDPVASTSSPSDPADNTDSRLEKEHRRLKDKLKRLENKLELLENQKLAAVDHAHTLSLELQKLREGNENAPSVLEFTESEDVRITTEEMEQLSSRSSSDSMFVGLLLTKIIGPERLITMSATGQPSRRFAKLTHEDGSLMYPPKEAVDQYIIDFLCDKVAQRNQKLYGVRNVGKIRHTSSEQLIKAYITNKIGNLKKANSSRRNGDRNSH